MDIKAVLFDFDDTLTLPGRLDYAQIRKEIACPQEASILDYLEEIPDAEKRQAASAILDRHEMTAAAEASPAEWAEDLIMWLKDAGLKRGILTRNSRNALERSLANFTRIGREDFDLLLTRDDNLPVKPQPDGVLHAASVFGIAPPSLLMVGDYIYDIEAGNAAGAVTVFIESRKDRKFKPPERNYTIASLAQVREICENNRG